MIDAVILLAATAMLVFFGLAAWRLAAGPAPRRRSLARRIALLSVVALFVVGAATYKISNSRTFQFGGHIVQRVETSSPRVALTFDDGPAPGATEEALAVLGRYGVQGTFFLVGSDVEANMAQAREIAAGGHEIGNHTYSHSRMIFVSPSTVRDEIEQTDELIRQAGYRGDILFRSPFCKKLFVLPYYLAGNARTNVTFDLEPDSDGGLAGSATKMADYVVKNARPGSIILLHVMYGSRSESLKAVPLIIEGLRAKGFEFVTVSELLGAEPL